jgi:hypothetical protein
MGPVRIIVGLFNGLVLLAASSFAVHLARVPKSIYDPGYGEAFRQIFLVASAALVLPSLLSLVGLVAIWRRNRPFSLILVPGGILWLAYGGVVMFSDLFRGGAGSVPVLMLVVGAFLAGQGLLCFGSLLRGRP